MTFAQCKQKADHAIREGRDDDAREWLERANETKPGGAGVELHRCCVPCCPGLPYRASDRAHPCVETPDEPPPVRSPQSRIDAALVSIAIFLECIEDEMRADSPLSQYANMTQARRLREIRAELRGER